MKIYLKILVLALTGTALLTFACSKPAEKPANPAPDKATYKVTGVIKAVNAETSQLTIAHDEIAGYRPASELTMPVADPSLAQNVTAGDKVEFDVLREGSSLMITRLIKSEVPQTTDPRSIYLASCAKCHGDNGEGKPKGIPLIKGHALYHGEEDMFATVTNGKKGKDGEMPSFRDKYSAEQIRELVKFVRMEIQAGKAESGKGKH